MKKKKRPKVYLGAGLLVLVRLPGNRLFVLLGKRKYRPFSGTWTFPGGAHEQRDLSLAHTALREAKEEIKLTQLSTIEVDWLVPVFRCNLWHYRWITYGVTIECTELPQVGILHEFSELTWFPVNQLPDPLHWGVGRAVRRAIKQAIRMQ